MFTQLLLTLVVVTTVAAQVQFDNSTCGIVKGCMWSPPGCDPAKNCVKAFSWRVDGDYLDMELTGASPGGTTNFIAVGFSSDDKMGDEPVTDCTFGPRGTTTHLSYNVGNSNQRITDYTAQSNDLQLLNSSNSNGRLYCAIRQRILPSQSNNRVLPLNRNVFILLAASTATDRALNQHDMTEGAPGFPFVAPKLVNLSDMTAFSPSTASPSTTTTKTAATTTTKTAATTKTATGSAGATKATASSSSTPAPCSFVKFAFISLLVGSIQKLLG